MGSIKLTKTVFTVSLEVLMCLRFSTNVCMTCKRRICRL